MDLEPGVTPPRQALGEPRSYSRESLLLSTFGDLVLVRPGWPINSTVVGIVPIGFQFVALKECLHLSISPVYHHIMKNSSAAIPKPETVSGTWSTKARSGSPQPMLKTGDALNNKMPKDNSNAITQRDALYGIGAQFSGINSSVKNMDTHPNL
ncbi:hypothetical protein TrVGV298_000886 [Trichoderma virens]|nr:hypothetical protein TrVGV298_000886 [Trichoderma virens]UKZ73263.1 hypothetical protein TrVFT333_000906 [Trichoderma virens FT-333]